MKTPPPCPHWRTRRWSGHEEQIVLWKDEADCDVFRRTHRPSRPSRPLLRNCLEGVKCGVIRVEARCQSGGSTREKTFYRTTLASNDPGGRGCSRRCCGRKSLLGSRRTTGDQLQELPRRQRGGCLWA